jgi:hypothetical protein
VVIVLSLEAIPIGALVSATFDRSLRRRSRFRLRLAGVVIAMLLPALVTIAAPLSDQAATTLFLLGLGWGLLLFALSSFFLFQGRDFESGPADDDDGGGGDGPGPEDDRPTPPAPIGGIPLPDAQQSATRLRDHPLPRPAVRPRRPVRDRERRVPSRSPTRS